MNFSETTPFRHIKSNLIGKFVCLKGTVIRVGNIKPLVTRMDFKCLRCTTMIPCYFKEGKFKSPLKCLNTQCRSKSFIPDKTNCISKDWQRIRFIKQKEKLL